jgi:hypothetical protein
VCAAEVNALRRLQSDTQDHYVVATLAETARTGERILRRLRSVPVVSDLLPNHMSLRGGRLSRRLRSVPVASNLLAFKNISFIGRLLRNVRSQ